jgi:hypothetical protein
MPFVQIPLCPNPVQNSLILLPTILATPANQMNSFVNILAPGLPNNCAHVLMPPAQQALIYYPSHNL